MVENYDDPDGPRWSGEYAVQGAPLDDELRVVTFNIEFAIEIDKAIATLRDSEQLNHAQVLLLQEMDEGGTERIAKALGYDYVYYPSSRHEDDRNYGEAVLSVWPIVRDRKLLLPHLDPLNGRLRIAVLAVLDTPRGQLGVASVHSNVPTLGPEARLDQARYVRDAALELGMPVIVGGDFNTSDWAVDATAAVFTQKGFDWASKGVHDTGSWKGEYFLDLDHVFSFGLPGLAAGSVSTDASDHRPLWVTLDSSRLPQESASSELGAGGSNDGSSP
jgi:endonuclease/exonuclease/phosphatase (EEP) superfamily protein YafD